MIGVILGGSWCTLDGGEIALCNVGIQLVGNNNTIRDVLIESVSTSVSVLGGSHWALGGGYNDAGGNATLPPQIAAVPGAALTQLGVGAGGNSVADILLPAAVSAAGLSGLKPVMASYRMAAPVVTVSPSQVVVINFVTREWDSQWDTRAPMPMNGAPTLVPLVTTGAAWSFRCPFAGVYRISACIVPMWGSAAGSVWLRARLGGVPQKSAVGYCAASASCGITLVAELMCVAGDLISVDVLNATSGTITLDPVNWAPQYVHIERIQGS